jgi:all-trans-8'-apo-beta-carotenal 15,15'-oxygenase
MKYLLDKSPAQVLSLTTGPATLHFVPRCDSSRPRLSIPLPVDDHSDANLHVCNAYEDGETIVMDIIRSKEIPPSRQAKVGSLKWPWGQTLREYQSLASKKSLWRYTVNLKSQKVEKTLLCDNHCAFGTINPAKSTLAHRYIYMNVGALGEETAPPQGIARFDCTTRQMQSWMPQTYEFCGEPMYAPRQSSEQQPASTATTHAEDDGYILSVLFNGKTEQSEIIIFQADKIAQGPITRIPLGMAIPHGYFGCFSASEESAWSYKAIERRAKLADKMESQGNKWNEVKSDFSGLGLRFDDMEEYFGDWNPFA